jgi:hypothetical protein
MYLQRLELIIDNTNLIAAIEMVEQDRADSLYIMTTPDVNSGGDIMSVEDVVGLLDGGFDSNYSATYYCLGYK